MIRWKIIKLDDPGLLGYAKAQVVRLLAGGAMAVDKKMSVSGAEIDVRAVHGPVPGMIVAYISIIKSGLGDALIPLGSASAVFDVLSGKPTTPAVHAITSSNILGALLTNPFIAYVSAYLNITNTYVIASSLFGVDNITDPQAGSIAVADIISVPRQYDFGAQGALVEYKITNTTYQKGWAALSLPAFVEPSSATFDVQTEVVDNVKRIVDGTQVFALPMMNGAFTLNISIVFTDGKITSSTSTAVIGNWRYTRVSVAIVNKFSVKIVYQQTYLNKRFFAPLYTRQFSLPQSIPGTGSVVDSYTDIRYTYATLPLKNLSSVVTPAYFIVNDTYIQSVVVGFLEDFVGEVVLSRSEDSTTSLSVMNSDGTLTPPLVGDRVGFSVPNHSNPQPDPATAASYVVFGENGTTRTGLASYASSAEADNGEWITTLGAHSLRHYRPVSIPAIDEAYDVQYSGVTLRSALKNRNNIFSGANINEDHSTKTSVLHGDGSISDGNSVYIGTMFWDNDAMFPEYDAALSIVPDVLVIVNVNVKTPSMGTTVIVLLPFGWGVKCTADFRRFSLKTVPGGSARDYLVEMRDEFDAAITFNQSFTDMSEAIASKAKMVELISNIDNASYIDPDDPPHTDPRVPTDADVLKAMLKYFKPLTKILTSASVSTEVALAAGSGTYLLVKS